MTKDREDAMTQDFKTWLFKQGVTTVLLVLLGGFVGWYLVIPMRDMQQRMMMNAIETNAANAATNASNAATNATNSALLGRVVESQSTTQRHAERTVQLLEQIRDDQRSFPAVAEKRRQEP